MRSLDSRLAEPGGHRGEALNFAAFKGGQWRKSLASFRFQAAQMAKTQVAQPAVEDPEGPAHQLTPSEREAERKISSAGSKLPKAFADAVNKQLSGAPAKANGKTPPRAPLPPAVEELETDPEMLPQTTDVAPTRTSGEQTPADAVPEDALAEQQPLPDEEQPEGDAESQGQTPWLEDAEVQENAEAFGLTPEELQAEFGSREEFDRFVRLSDRKLLAGGIPQAEVQQWQPAAQPQVPAQAAQQPQVPAQPPQPGDPLAMIEEALKDELLDDSVKKGFTAIRDAIKAGREQAQQAQAAMQQRYVAEQVNQLYTTFDQYADELAGEMGVGEFLGKALNENGELLQLDRLSLAHRKEMLVTALTLAQRHAERTGSAPTLTKALVRRAFYGTFPQEVNRTAQRTLAKNVKSQSQRRLGTTAASQHRPQPADPETQAVSDVKAAWSRMLQDNGSTV